MRSVSAGDARCDLDKAREVLSRHALPRGIFRFELEADEDQDGDPVMWVWLDGEDTSRWSEARRDELAAFLATLKQALFDALEDYRPHFRLRTASPPRGVARGVDGTLR